jgi:glucosamine-6-phosphate deaminase
MAKYIVPLSPKEVDLKTMSILKHQTQKDNPMFPGEDRREFWERVKIRNRNTANTLHTIGLSLY